MSQEALNNCWEEVSWKAKLPESYTRSSRDAAFVSGHPFWGGLLGDAIAFELSTLLLIKSSPIFLLNNTNKFTGLIR